MTATDLDITANEGKATPDTAKVFLSYSRKDRERAQAIADVLRERHFGVFKDTDDILPTEEWQGRLEQLIGEADTIVFLLSPHSLASEVCAWEVEYAKSLNKRIAPIVIDEVDSGEIPPDLARLNFIFCTERDRFQDAIDNLISALSVDIGWVREHTRLAELARRWTDADKSGRLLLRGQDISDAEAWRDSHPAEAPLVSAPQAALISASRSAAIRRQRSTVIASVIGLLIALGLAGFAYLQREQALTAQTLAVQQRDAAQTNQSLLLNGFAADKLKNWAPVEAALLSLEAMPDQRSIDALQRSRPLVGEAHVMLHKAHDQIVEQAVLLALPGSSATRNANFSVSPNERWVAVYAPSEDALFIIDLSGQLPLRQIIDSLFVGTAKTLSFNSASTMVAVSSKGGKVQIIPLDPAKPIKTLAVSEKYITLAQFINDGKEILSLDQAGVIRVLDIEAATVSFTSKADVAVASANSERFALYSDLQITIFDAKTKAILGVSKRNIGLEDNPVQRLVFSHNNKWLAAANGNQTFIVNGTSGEFRGKTNAQQASVLAFGFGPQGNWHYVSNFAGKTDVFDMDSATLVSSHKKQSDWITDVGISDDHSAILTSSNSGWMQLWKPETNEVMAYLGGSIGSVEQARLINGGLTAISLSSDGTVRQWSLDKWVGAPKGTLRGTKIEGFSGQAVYTADRQIMALSEAGIFRVESGERIIINGLDELNPSYRRFDDSGQKLLLMTGSSGGMDWSDVCLADIRSNSEIRCFVNRSGAKVFDADMDNQATTIVMKEVIDTVRHYFSVDIKTGLEIGRMTFKYSSRLGPPVLSANGEFVFILDKEQTIQVYERSLSKLIASFGPNKDGARIVFSPNREQLLFYWPVEDTAELWNTTSRKRLRAFRLKHSVNAPPIFSPSGAYIVSRHTGTELGIYSTEDGTLISSIEIRSQQWLERPVFSADEQFITADVDGKLRVWDVSTGRQVVEYKVDVRDASPILFGKAFVDEDRSLVAWSWHGPTKWDLLPNPQLVVQATQEKTPRCLSRSQRKQFFLPLAPPRWCITGPGLEAEADSSKWRPKWPYHSTAWRDWLIATDKGETLTLPE